MSKNLMLASAIGLVLFIILVPTPAGADGPDPGRYKPDVAGEVPDIGSEFVDAKLS